MLSEIGPEWNPLAISAPLDSCTAPRVSREFYLSQYLLLCCN